MLVTVEEDSARRNKGDDSCVLQLFGEIFILVIVVPALFPEMCVGAIRIRTLTLLGFFLWPV